MRLSWNEIRARAARFARDRAGQGYEKGRTRLFYRDFFEVFGVSTSRPPNGLASCTTRSKRPATPATISTASKNILKVIGPLFLDGLRAEFEHIKARKDTHRRVELERFHDRLGRLTLFDPACGCGNFLIIAYRELRALEIELLRELRAYRDDTRTLELDVAELSRISVAQFHGIEIGEFPAHIAETALWMMDHIMNNRLSLEFGQSYTRIPLKRSPATAGERCGLYAQMWRLQQREAAEAAVSHRDDPARRDDSG